MTTTWQDFDKSTVGKIGSKIVNMVNADQLCGYRTLSKLQIAKWQIPKKTKFTKHFVFFSHDVPT